MTELIAAALARLWLAPRFGRADDPFIMIKTSFNFDSQAAILPVILQNSSQYLVNSTFHRVIQLPIYTTYFNIRTTRQLYHKLTLLSSSCLNKLVTNKGDIYYGNCNIVLDKDFKLLYMGAFMSPISEGNFQTDISNRIVLVSKDVFSRNDLLCKFIKKEMIPHFASLHIETRILDISNYVVNLENPEHSESVNAAVEALSNTIVENLSIE